MLYLIRGLPGSGKSYYARIFISADQADVHLEADMYHMVNGVYKFVGDNVYAAHKWCQESTRIFLNNDMGVVISNTFTQKKEIQPYLDMAKDIGVDVKIYRCTQNYGSIHNVPDEVIQKMKARFEDYEGEIFV